MDEAVIQLSAPSLYGRITDDLLHRIAAGELKPGDALPTEAEMCRQYGVSRITIRRAVADLVARRLVVRRAGVGSFVSPRPATLREFHLTGFLDDKRGHSSRTLMNAAEPADEAVAAALALPPGQAVRHIRSLVLRDGVPFTVADAYTADLPGRRLREADYRSPMPLAATMGLRLGRQVARAEQKIDAVAADPAVARHLGVPPGTPLIRTRRTYFSTGGEPIQYLMVQYHPERHTFIVDLLPRAGAAAFEATTVRSGEQGTVPLPPGPGRSDAFPTRRRGRPRRAEIT